MFLLDVEINWQLTRWSVLRLVN